MYKYPKEDRPDRIHVWRGDNSATYFLNLRDDSFRTKNIPEVIAYISENSNLSDKEISDLIYAIDDGYIHSITFNAR
jgi:hypothetical protein